MKKNWLTTLTACSLVVAIAAFAFAGPGKGDDAQGTTTSLVGKPAPDWSFPVLGNAKTIKLSTLKGDVVFMDYWATWCPPCRESLPHVQELANDTSLTSKGLHVFAINSKEPIAKAKKFVTDNKYTFTVLMDEQGKFGKDYLVRGIPTSVVVGRDGTIKKVFVGFSEGGEKEIRAAIEEALKEEAPAKTS
jgi:peroxiredoxin